MKKIYKDIDMYIESHCELCTDPVHAHFECPKCKNDEYYQGFGFINNSYYDEIKKGDIIYCEDCKNKFKIIEWDMDFILEDYK